MVLVLFAFRNLDIYYREGYASSLNIQLHYGEVIVLSWALLSVAIICMRRICHA